MTLIDTFTQDGEVNSTSTGWDTIASRALALSRICIIDLGCEYGGSVTNRAIQIRIVVNSNQKATDYHTPSMTVGAGGFKRFSYHAVVDPPAPDTLYDVEVQVRVESSPQQVTVRNLAMSVMQE